MRHRVIYFRLYESNQEFQGILHGLDLALVISENRPYRRAFRFGLFVLFYAHQDHGQIPVHEVVRESAHRLQDAISLEMGFFVLDAVGFELAFSEVLQSYLFNIVGIHFITSFLDFCAIYAIQCPNLTMKVHFFQLYKSLFDDQNTISYISLKRVAYLSGFSII